MRKTQLEVAEGVLKSVEMRVNAGLVSPADLLRAKAHCLGAKIDLLRKRARQEPQTK